MKSHEELLSFSAMHDRTRGQDIFASLQEIIRSFQLDMSKCASVTTDGAAAMTKTFVAALQSEYGAKLAFHCIIHQECLCSKASNDTLRNVMKVVTQLVNYIRANSLNHRQFQSFLNEINAEYKDVVYHSEVRWLSRGQVLHRFISLLPAINDFLEKKGEKKFDQYLTDQLWMRDLCFLADLTNHLNSLNI